MSEENPLDSTKDQLNPEPEVQESEPADQENQETSAKEEGTDTPKEEGTDTLKECTDTPKAGTDTPKECTDTPKECTDTYQPAAKPAEKKTKIEIRLQATGDAPIMKQRNYKVSHLLDICNKFTRENS